MTTIIDALVLELGLDPTKFIKGQAATQAALNKQKEALTKSGKEIEERTKRASEFFSQLSSKALQFLALVTGGKGLEQFAKDLIASDFQVGKLSRSTGLSVPILSKLQNAIRLAGGDAGEAAGTIQSLSDRMHEWGIGILNSTVPALNAIGVSGGRMMDITRGEEQVFKDLSFNLHAIATKYGPGYAKVMADQAGITGSFFDVLVRGEPAFAKFIAQAEKMGQATAESEKNARGLIAAFWEMVEGAEEFGRNVFLGPATTALLAKREKGKEAWETYLASRAGETDPIKRQMLGLPPLGLTTPTGPTAPLKAGATAGGPSNPALIALAQMFAGDIKEVTALNDLYHAGTTSKHAQGLALDMTLKDPSKSAEFVDKLKNKLAAMNVMATVIDEYLNPSPGSTAGHIHVGFASQAAAANYLNQIGAGAAATSNINNSNRSVDVRIDHVHVNAPHATDAKGIANALTSDVLRAYIDRHSLASQSLSGQN